MKTCDALVTHKGIASTRRRAAQLEFADRHCHLESILARSSRGGGLPAVTKNEPLVALWPQALDSCVSNFVFRRDAGDGGGSGVFW